MTLIFVASSLIYLAFQLNNVRLRNAIAPQAQPSFRRCTEKTNETQLAECPFCPKHEVFALSLTMRDSQLGWRVILAKLCCSSNWTLPLVQSVALRVSAVTCVANSQRLHMDLEIRSLQTIEGWLRTFKNVHFVPGRPSASVSIQGQQQGFLLGNRISAHVPTTLLLNLSDVEIAPLARLQPTAVERAVPCLVKNLTTHPHQPNLKGTKRSALSLPNRPHVSTPQSLPSRSTFS